MCAQWSASSKCRRIVKIVVCAAPALAQDRHAEVSFLAGWAFSEGADGNAVLAGDGNITTAPTPRAR